MAAKTIKGLPEGAAWEAAKAELNWLVHRSKVPTLPGEGTVGAQRAAKWTFDQAQIHADACNVYAETGDETACYGIGYLPRPGAAMRALDFDDCIGPDGTIASEVAALLGESFCEVSLSGKGLRTWFAASAAPGEDIGTERGGFGASGVDGKFFAFTGTHLSGTPREVAPAPKALAAVLAKTGALDRGARKDAGQHDGPLELIDEAATEAQLDAALTIDEALSARWHGGKTGLADDSRSGLDLAVIGGLVRHGFSFSQVVHLMLTAYRQPSAAVEKWNSGNEREMRRAFARALSGNAGARPADPSEEFEPVEIEGARPADGARDGAKAVAPKVLWVEHAGGVAPDLDEFWRVDKVLPLEGIGVLYGKPGCGKTFAALDMAARIATGLDWHGREVDPCEVVYVASEGGVRAARNRIAGWQRENDRLDTGRLHCAAAAFDLPNGAGSLLAALRERGIRPRLVVIDTLARNFGGEDENTPQGMGKFLAAVSQLQRELGCFVLVIHHSGKDESRGARGHSSLLGAVDFEAEIKGEAGGVRTLTVTKLRDGPEGQDFAFRLSLMVLGHDRKGAAVTTCVAVPADAAENPQLRARAMRGLGDAQKRALRTLEDLHFHAGGPVDFDSWAESVKKDTGGDSRGNIGRTLQSLIARPHPVVREVAAGLVEPIFPSLGDAAKAASGHA